MQSLFYNTANLIQMEDGSIGMVIDAKVPASMRSAIYDTTIAQTANDILAVECNCKRGSKGDDRVVCVHSCSVLYKLMELLLEDLAEHILLKLTPCVPHL